MTLSWTPSPFADAYEIEADVNSGSGFAPFTSVAATVLSYDLGPASSAARYRVRARAGGDFGPWSNVVTILIAPVLSAA